MTKQTAIDIIEEQLFIADMLDWDTHTWALREKDKEALRMALEALEKRKEK